MRRMKISGLPMFLVLLVCFACAPSGPNVKEGKWEITTKMEMTGMPMQFPSKIHTQCLSGTDLVPQKVEAGQNCKMIKQDIKGDTVTWAMECETSQGTALFNGQVTYQGETFEGVVTMKEGDTEITMTQSGKWLGKCE